MGLRTSGDAVIFEEVRGSDEEYSFFDCDYSLIAKILPSEFQPLVFLLYREETDEMENFWVYDFSEGRPTRKTGKTRKPVKERIMTSNDCTRPLEKNSRFMSIASFLILLLT